MSTLLLYFSLSLCVHSSHSILHQLSSSSSSSTPSFSPFIFLSSYTLLSFPLWLPIPCSSLLLSWGIWSSILRGFLTEISHFNSADTLKVKQTVSHQQKVIYRPNSCLYRYSVITYFVICSWTVWKGRLVLGVLCPSFMLLLMSVLCHTVIIVEWTYHNKKCVM